MQEQIGDIQLTVVCLCLVQRLLGQRDGLRLALNEHQRLHLSVIDYRVASLVPLAYRDGLLHGDEGSRKAKLLHQPVKQLLAYPFLRRQAHPLFAPFAEDLLFTIVYARAHYFR